MRQFRCIPTDKKDKKSSTFFVTKARSFHLRHNFEEAILFLQAAHFFLDKLVAERLGYVDMLNGSIHFNRNS